jgi:hypothetical protein
MHWVGYDQVILWHILKESFSRLFHINREAEFDETLDTNCCMKATKRTARLLGTILCSMLFYSFENIVVIFLLLLASSSFLERTQLREVLQRSDFGLDRFRYGRFLFLEKSLEIDFFPLGVYTFLGLIHVALRIFF